MARRFRFPTAVLVMVVGLAPRLGAQATPPKAPPANAGGSGQSPPPSALQKPDIRALGPESRAVSLTSTLIAPIAPPASGQTGRLTIVNQSDATQQVLLSFGQPRRGTEAVNGTFLLLAGTTAQPLPRPEYYAEIPAKKSAYVPFSVSDLKASGEITAPLLNWGAPLGEVTVNRYPFAVTVENVQTPLAINGDAPTVLTLTNGDPVDYEVDVEVTVAGQCLYGSRLASGTVRSCLKVRLPWSPEPEACKPERVIVPASQKRMVELYPRCQISSGIFTGLFRDESRPVRLSLTHAAPAGAPSLPRQWPAAIVSMSATIGYGFLSEFWRQVWGTVLIGVVLTLGGVASVVARYWVPNELARHRLLERVERVDLKASNLSEHIGAELRLALRVNAKRLTDLLKSLPAISADTSVILGQQQKLLEFVDTRVNELQHLEAAWQRLRQVVPEEPAPSLVQGVENRLRKAAGILGTPDATATQLEKAHTLIDEALTAMETLTTIDEAFETAAAERLDSLRSSFESECGLAPTDAKAARMRALLPGPFCLFDKDQPKDAWFDCNLVTLELIRDYLRIYSRSTEPAVRQALEQREPELLTQLGSSSPSGLREARLLIKQMHEGIYESDVLEAIRQRQFGIQCDPKTFGSYQLVTLAVTFNRPEMNTAAARERFTCLWQFPEAGESPLPAAQSTELGWEIRHYFVGGRAATEHPVRVSFLNPAGDNIKAGPAEGPAGEVIGHEEVLRTTAGPSHRSSGRMRAEWVGLIVVLFIALLGLITGAREQITKLDLVPGLIAVFLLGFGADAIKTLLTQQPEPGGTT